MTTLDSERMLAKIRSAATCTWLALETVGWMAVYYLQAPLALYFKWRLARLSQERDAARLEYERVQGITS